MDSIWRDLLFSARMLRKSPTFTIVASLTIAIGMLLFNSVDNLSYQIAEWTSIGPTIQFTVRVVLAAVVLLPPTVN